MSLDDIQKDVEKWISQFKEGYWPLIKQLGELTEETGELAREILHEEGTKIKKENELGSCVGDEIADVIFVLACMANNKGISLQQYWDKMMQERLYKRDNNRYERKDEQNK